MSPYIVAFRAPHTHAHVTIPLPKVASPPCHILPLHCQILPLLPPITRNVKLPDRATRLELSIRAGSPFTKNVKSGKNGNVDHPSQLSPSPSVILRCLRSSMLTLLSLLSSSVCLRVLCGRSRLPPPQQRLVQRAGAVA